MPSRKRVTRYVLYNRVSNERQDVENSMSAQDAAGRKYVDNVENGVLLRTYSDEAKTGRVDKRPAFQEMMRDAADPDKTFDVVLVWKHNRFARNRLDSVNYKTYLANLGIKVVSIAEDTGEGPASRMVEGIIESVDEYHSANMGVDIKRGMRNSVERGFYMARSAPMGYRKYHVQDGGKFRPKLELDPPWDLIPRRVFELALRDCGYKQIILKLDEEGIRNQSGGKISQNRVVSIIKNRHYTGYTFWDYRHNNDNYAKSLEPAHEAIISPEDWQTVQEKFASRHRTVKHPRTVAAEHLFNDIGVCTQCGHKMAIKGSQNNKYMFFVCSTRLKYGVKNCDMPRYPLSKNDPILMDAIINDILNEKNVATMLDTVLAESGQNYRSSEDKLAELESRAAELDAREDQLLLAMEMKTFSMAKITQRMNAVQAERKDIEEQQQSILSESDSEPAFLQDRELVLAYAKDLQTYLQKENVNSANAMMKRFIKKISFEQGWATIHYMTPIPDGTPVGKRYQKLALRRRVHPTVSGGPPTCRALKVLRVHQTIRAYSINAEPENA